MNKQVVVFYTRNLELHYLSSYAKPVIEKVSSTREAKYRLSSGGFSFESGDIEAGMKVYSRLS